MEVPQPWDCSQPVLQPRIRHLNRLSGESEIIVLLVFELAEDETTRDKQ
jgi:hypothetical protein